ncbi:uncharacterized protein LOC133795332 [Humulus lupulus]|uniref:uncharacterized protein LOC133795332 n=1 Tax=Humulus lupulus TaxID=3486 RepID=UPI002B406828|nr:uncharacterized protein LOC133795332 [Humulus lupulus]
MDIRNWCSSGSKKRTIRLGSCHKETAKSSSTTQALNPYKQIWKVLWMKFKKEKKKLSESLESCAAPQQRRLVPYDPHSYSQNFDISFAWDDIHHDDDDDGDSLISRSFSFRFADPSKIFLEKAIV